MSNSFADWRINVSESAAPITLTSNPLSIGALVIKSIKGNAEPTILRKGENDKLFRLFGYPSASFPHVQEAYDYLQDSDCWISAPSDTTNAVYGGALVTKTGSVPLTKGVADIDLLNFTNVPWQEEIGVGDDIAVNYIFSLTGLNYVNVSLSKIIVGTTEIDVSVTDAEPEVITGTGITSGTLTRATKQIDVTFDTAPALGESVQVVYEVDYSSDAYWAIFSPSQHVNDEAILVNYNTDIDQFEFDFYIDDFRGNAKKVDRYIGSNIPNTFNASNENIFMETYLEDVPYFTVKANTELPYTTFTDDTALVDWAGGVRDTTTFTSTEIAEGWTFFQDSTAYPANIFMDVTADSSVPTIFDNLRKNYQKYQRYILPLPDSEDATTSIATKAGYSIDNSGLSFYANWIFRKEVFTNTKFWSSAIGATGVSHAKILREAFGGLAPAGTNENGLGGQLSIRVEKIRYGYSDTELRQLDEAGINPRFLDTTYGLIITSQKTGQNPAILTDFSYIGHRGTADFIISNVIKQALTQQAVKLNDPSHRAVVKSKTDSIVDPVEGRGLLRQYLTKCDDENNNDEVLARREFRLDLAVKFTPFSEFIFFNFISVDQTVDVEEALGV